MNQNVTNFHEISEKSYKEILDYIENTIDINPIALTNLFTLLIKRKIYNSNIFHFLYFLKDNNYLNFIFTAEFIKYFETDKLLVLNVAINELDIQFDNREEFNLISEKIINLSKIDYQLYDFAFMYALRSNNNTKIILQSYADTHSSFDIDIKFYDKLEKNSFDGKILHLELRECTLENCLDYFIERKTISGNREIINSNKAIVYSHINFDEDKKIIKYSNYHITQFLIDYTISEYHPRENSILEQKSFNGINIIDNTKFTFKEKLYIINNFILNTSVFNSDFAIKPLIFFVLDNITTYEELAEYESLRNRIFHFFITQLRDYEMSLLHDMLKTDKVDVIQSIYRFKNTVSFKKDIQEYILNNIEMSNLNNTLYNLESYLELEEIEYVIGNKTITFLLSNYGSLLSNRFDENFSRLFYNDSIRYILAKHSAINDNLSAFLEFYNFNKMEEETNEAIIKYILDNEKVIVNGEDKGLIALFKYLKGIISKESLLNDISIIFINDHSRSNYEVFNQLIEQEIFSIEELNNCISSKAFILGANMHLYYYSDYDSVAIIPLIKEYKEYIFYDKKLIDKLIGSSSNNSINLLEYYLKKSDDVEFVREILNLSIELKLDISGDIKNNLFFLLEKSNSLKGDVFQL
jgi:hypothetical protein